MSEMDKAVTDLLNEAGEKGADPLLGSLEHRVAERRKHIEKRTSESFDVPGFEDVFRVELRVIGPKQQHAIAQKHEHCDEYQQILRTAADLLVVATVGFYAVDGDGQVQPAEDASWKRFAKAFDPMLDQATLERPGGGRVAIVRLLGEEATLVLAGKYKQWVGSRGAKVDKELQDL